MSHDLPARCLLNPWNATAAVNRATQLLLSYWRQLPAGPRTAANPIPMSHNHALDLCCTSPRTLTGTVLKWGRLLVTFEGEPATQRGQR